MRFSVILDCSERFFVFPEQPVRAGECLNHIGILKNFIQVQSVYPLGIKSCQHLVDDNQQIYLFFRLTFNPFVRFLVRKSCGDILFHFRPSRNCEILIITLIIIFNQLLQTVFFDCGSIHIINTWVKKGGHLQIRLWRFNSSVVFQGFGNTAGCKNGVEFAVLRKDKPIFQDVFDNFRLVNFSSVLNERDIILDALCIGSVTFIMPGHWNFILEFQKFLFLCRVCKSLFYCFCLRLFQSHLSS